MTNPTENPPPEIKVAIMEDLRDVREGLAMLINGTSGFRCVGRFRSVEEAAANITREVPDIVLTGIGLPGVAAQQFEHLIENTPAALAAVTRSSNHEVICTLLR